MIISASKEWLLKYVVLVLLISIVAIAQLGIDNNKLEKETNHYKQLAIDNSNDVTYWHQEALNWETLYYVLYNLSPDNQWIIVGE